MNRPTSPNHDERLAAAFDGQAAMFEQAPVQTDPAALERLVAAADFPPDSLVFDAGCGPGLVSLALLEAGHRVVGVDLSTVMIDRARARCASFGARGRFERRSIAEDRERGTFDGSISRYVLHHVIDPVGFVRDQVALLRPGGVLVLADQLTAAHPDRADDHTTCERLRDATHTQNLSLGTLVHLFEQAGLVALRATEEPFTLDFDEWFDRGTPAAPKAEVRARIAALTPSRAVRPVVEPDGRLTLHCHRGVVRGVVPDQGRLPCLCPA